MNDSLRCRHCGDLIGVYEPLVTVVDDRPLETSKLAGPMAVTQVDSAYHRGCYEQIGAELHGGGSSALHGEA